MGNTPDHTALRLFLKSVRGKRISIGGNRNIGPKTAKRIRSIVKSIPKSYQLVTGGADGADHAVMQAASDRALIVYLPLDIESQYRCYVKLEGVRKARRLRATLERIKSHGSVIEGQGFRNYRKAANARNSRIIRASSGFIMFEPRGSPGSQDALKKIFLSGKPCLVFE